MPKAGKKPGLGSPGQGGCREKQDRRVLSGVQRQDEAGDYL